MFGLRAASRLTVGEVVQVNGWPVRLAVNTRARRINLRIDVGRRQGVATAPNARRLADALAFARSRGPWLADRLAALPVPTAFVPGGWLTVGGEPCRLERAAMRIRPRFIPARGEEPARLIAAGAGEAYVRAVVRGLRAEALMRLTTRTEVHSAVLGQAAPLVRLQDARGRWGSCRQARGGAAAVIRYNWRLVLAPPAVLDYVAAHECAHLVEANHGQAFWTTVETLYGDPARPRAWLRRHGAQLMAEGVAQD